MLNLDRNSIKTYFNTTVDKVESLLLFFQKNKWDLAIADYNTKEPIGEGWQKEKHTDINEWVEWLNKGNNIVLKNGVVSGTTTIDIDQSTIPIEIMKIIGKPLTQKTTRGYHLIYQYEKDLPDRNFNDLKIEIRNSSGRCILIQPSLSEGKKRQFIELKEIPKMPDELKDYFIKKIKSNSKTIKVETGLGKVEEKEILINNEPIGDLISGNRNQGLLRLLGRVRKHASMEVTTKLAHLLNENVVKPPLPFTEVKAMLGSLTHYKNEDVHDLAMKVYEYLRKAEEATEKDIAYVLKEDGKDIIIALDYLLKEEYIIKSNRLYKVRKKPEWKDHIPESLIRPLDFEVPYFERVMNYCWGDLLLLCGESGSGKCIANGYVLTPEGFQDIEEQGKQYDLGFTPMGSHRRIYTGNPKHKTFRKPNAFFKEYTEKTIKITTKNGYEIEGTFEHPIKIISQNKIEFKKLEDLKINDVALIMPSYKFPKTNFKISNNIPKVRQFPKEYNFEFNENFSRLLGYIIGDGCFIKNTKSVQIFFDKKYPKIIDEVVELCNKMDISVHKYERKNHFILQIHNFKFVTMCKRQLHIKNYNNLKSPERYIPNCVMKSSEKTQKSFIEAIFNCESNLNSKKGNSYLEITMSSKKLINQLQLMLLNFGILSNRRIKKVKNYPNNEYWRLTLTVEMTKLFFEIFNIVKYNYIQKYPIEKRVSCKKDRKGKIIYFYDKVFKIEYFNDKKLVYDYNIKGHQFWSNGFISHNTHQVCNILKRLVDQNIKPYIITTESGSRLGKITRQLGIPDKSFYWDFQPDPVNIELPKESVVIIDWLSLGGRYAEADKIFQQFVNQLDKTGSFLIVFMQLREGGDFFAYDLIKHFPAMIAKYEYLGNPADEFYRIYGKWIMKKIRDEKNNGWRDIICKYNKDSKIILTLDELDEDEQDKISKKECPF